jgi:hypothetical protein
MWEKYQVEMQIEGEFAAAIPRTEKEIRAMLEHRMPGKKPDNAVPIDDLADVVSAEVGIDDELEDQGFLPGWATFKFNNDGLYYEGRCVRGHIKDCALQVASFHDIKNFRAKLVNRLYVLDAVIPLTRLGKRLTKPDATEQRFIQVMTRQGPRSSIKYIDYVTDPLLTFTLGLMDDEVIGLEHLESVFEYGAVHGIGQERSQGWGRYAEPKITKL